MVSWVWSYNLEHKRSKIIHKICLDKSVNIVSGSGLSSMVRYMFEALVNLPLMCSKIFETFENI